MRLNQIAYVFLQYVLLLRVQLRVNVDVKANGLAKYCELWLRQNHQSQLLELLFMRTAT